MSGHTPGPWTATRNAHGWTIAGPAPLPDDYPAMWLIAETVSDEPEDAPNAQLIAAAPDLLEAVRAGGRYSDALLRYQEHGVRGQLVPPTDELERLFLEWHDKGHAAIAKAEGR